MNELTDQDRAMLELERSWWKYPAAKANAIAEFGMTETRYYQRLNALIDTPEALAHDPLTVRRLQRLRATRAARRRRLRDSFAGDL